MGSQSPSRMEWSSVLWAPEEGDVIVDRSRFGQRKRTAGKLPSEGKVGQVHLRKRGENTKAELPQTTIRGQKPKIRGRIGLRDEGDSKV